MKTLFRLGSLMLVLAFMVSCQKDDEVINSIDDIVIAENGIQNPQWLVKKVNSISDSYQPLPAPGYKLYPWVYVVKHKGQEYILVVDMLKSCFTCGNLFFTLSGKSIEPETDGSSGFYNDLCNEEDRTLLWPVFNP